MSPDLLREVAAETGRHVVLVAVSIGIATAIGVPLGVFIFRGVAMVDDRMILAGALPAALLAIGADVALGVIERALRPPR